MDIAAVLDLVTKGLGVINTLVTVGKDALPAIKVVTDLVAGAKAGTVTTERLDETEAALDAMIEEFDRPIP